MFILQSPSSTLPSNPGAARFPTRQGTPTESANPALEAVDRIRKERTDAQAGSTGTSQASSVEDSTNELNDIIDKAVKGSSTSPTSDEFVASKKDEKVVPIVRYGVIVGGTLAATSSNYVAMGHVANTWRHLAQGAKVSNVGFMANTASKIPGFSAFASWSTQTSMCITNLVSKLGSIPYLGGLFRGIGSIAKFGGGRILPGIGAALAAWSVGKDIYDYATSDGPGDIVAKDLEKFLDGKEINDPAKAIAAGRILAETDLSKPENIVALKQYLKDLGYGDSEAKELAEKAKTQQKQNKTDFNDAAINATATTLGGIIGGIIGSIIPGAGTALGIMIGMGIGNMVGSLFKSDGLFNGALSWFAKRL